MSDINISGLDVRQGIALSGGNEKYYIMALSAYCSDARKHIVALKPPTENELRDFTTRVHSLKSALRIIGAPSLAEEAAALEAAARGNDLALIKNSLILTAYKYE